MKTVQLIALVIAMLGAIILYVPSLFYKESERLTRGQLIETYPKLEWIRWVYPLFYGLVILWALVTGLIILIIFGESMGAVTFYFLGLLLCVPATFDGSIAVFTPVRPIPTRGGYLFVYEEKSRFISWLQVIVSLTIITFVAALAFV